MVDERSLFEKKVGSLVSVYRRAPGVEKLKLVANEKNPPEGTLSVTRSEAETWRWIDGKRSVGDIMERAFLSDFEVLKGTADLLGRHLIEPGALVRPEEPSAAAPALDRGRGSPPAIGLWRCSRCHLPVDPLDPENPANLFLRPVADQSLAADFFKAVSLSRRVDRARGASLRLSGRYPQNLEDLVVAGILHETRCAIPTSASIATSCGRRTGSSVSTATTPPARSTSTSRSSAASRPSRSCARRPRGRSPRTAARASWSSNSRSSNL
jgi:hypothetical protein